ncbi:MAG: serine hydrolase domain-containing protein [Actinomycetota bacterium]
MGDSAPERVGMSAGRLERIAPAMASYVERGKVAGISTLLSRRGEVVHTHQVGHRDREADLPMTDDTIFRIYSMTKPVVATALMLLVEEHGIRLTDPVAAFIPAFGATQVFAEDGSIVPPNRPIDLRDVLTHTSGLTYDFMEGSPADVRYREARIMNDASRTLEELAEAIAEIPLAFQPGTRWHYSVGTDVAARVVEVLSGQPLGRFLQDRLFDPLGMVDTGFAVPDDQLGRLSAMYGLPDLVGEGFSATPLVEAMLSGFNERIDVSATYPTDRPDTWARGGLGLFSTVRDYHRFAQLLLDGGRVDGERLIGRKTLELMHTNHLPEALRPYEILGQLNPGWGFGLASRVLLDVGLHGGPGSVGEFGWAGAAKTYYWVDPAEELVGVFMAQYMTGMESPEAGFRTLAYQAIDD